MKKILFLLISLFIFINVNALERNEQNNYGVNKRWIINDQNIDNVLATKYVDANEKIYDFSNVLTEEEKQLLRDEIYNFTQKYQTELIILIDNLPYSYDLENENYAADFYDYNDFGLNKPNYDGVLLFRNTYEIDPYYNMYNFGEAQLYFNNNRMDNILDNIYDNLHDHNYYQGFHQFINEIDKSYAEGIPNDLIDYEVNEQGELVINPILHKKQIKKRSILLSTLISVIASLIFCIVNVKKNKLVTKINEADYYIVSNSINYRNFQDILINKHITQHRISSSSSGGSGGGFHSSMGSSGGFHSSGGGRHG